MKKCVILIDNSNIFIEGQKFSARKKGIIKSNPMDNEPCDPSWRIEFGKLLDVISEGKVIHTAILVGSRPPKLDSVWDTAEEHGIEVIIHDKDSRNKEKAVDTELVTQGAEIICSNSEPMTLIICSGDRDFIPLVKLAHKKHWEVEMRAFTSAFPDSGLMATSVDHVKPLDIVFDQIGMYEFDWPISIS